VALYPCQCGEPVDVDTEHLGPWAAQLLLPPVRVICAACRDQLGLAEAFDPELGRPFLLRDGREYVLLGGAFVRSDSPRMAGKYPRDEQRGDEAQH